MSDHEELEPVLKAARELLDQQLASCLPAPDLADVLARAAELGVDVDVGLDADADPSAGADPSADAQVPPLLAQTDLDQLDQINADLREILDAALEPTLAPRARPATTRWRRTPRWWAASAAAVLFVAFVGVAAAHSYLQARGTGSTAPLVALVHGAVTSNQRQAEARVKELWTTSLQARLDPPVVELQADPAPTPPAASTEASDEPPAPRERASADELAELDAQAYALLRAGKREQARRKFKSIVKVGGRSEYAELAFGELFAIARRAGGEHELEKLWRAYLKKFSHGRYADDARAGLCRRAPDETKSKCWMNYLDKHPRGAARREASREPSLP